MIRPQFSPSGNLTWLQMKREGYEADRNDIIDFKGIKMNLPLIGTVQLIVFFEQRW
jgi:hypothetical protein